MPHLYDEDPRSTLLIIPSPIAFARSHRKLGFYFSGILFSLGWWIFIDAFLLSLIKNDTSWVDWIPGIASSLGLAVVNTIGKSYFQGVDNNNVWKARTGLLTGLTLLTGGFIGSLCLLGFTDSQTNQLNYGGVIQNGLILSSVFILSLLMQQDTYCANY